METRLRLERSQMHFDAALVRVPARLVREAAEREVRRSSSRLMRASRFRLKAAVTPAGSS